MVVFLLLLVFIVSNFSQALAAADTVMTQSCFLVSQPQEIPDQYCSLMAQQQIAQYRKVYDGHLSNFSESTNFMDDFQCNHVEGLFDILANGFALAKEYIDQDSPEAYGLEMLFKSAKKDEDRKELSQLTFLIYNMLVANLIDKFVANPDKEDPEESSFYSSNLSKDKKRENLTEAYYLIESAIIAQWGRVSSFHPPVVIYSRKSTGIAPRTFVDQRFNYTYPCALVLMDVSLKSFIVSSIGHKGQLKVGSKSSPHYALYHPVQKMMTHDIAHHSEQNEIEALNAAGPHTWERHMRQINNLRTSLLSTDPVKFHLLTNVLFMLSHELANINKTMKKGRNYGDDLFDNLEMIKNEMVGGIDLYYNYPPNYLIYYKQYLRDHEHLLKGPRNNTAPRLVDRDGIPFWPEDLKADLPTDTGENISFRRFMGKRNKIKEGMVRLWNEVRQILREALPPA